MVKVGDTVRFHAEFGLIDWKLEGDAELVRLIEWLDGDLAEVTSIEVSHEGEPLYVDLMFEVHRLYAISVVHLEPVPGVIIFRRRAS